MKIRFDYSWLPKEVRTEIGAIDPSKGDLAITAGDETQLSKDRYDQIIAIAAKYSPDLNPVTPFVINMPSGETLFLTDPVPGNEAWPLRQYAFSRAGAFSGDFILDPRTKRIFSAGSLGDESVVFGCKAQAIAGAKECTIDRLFSLTKPLAEHVYPNRLGERIIDRTAPDAALQMTKSANSSLLKVAREGGALRISLENDFLFVLERGQHLTLIADGEPIPLTSFDEAASIPQTTRDLKLRIADRFGNAHEIAFSRSDIDGMTFFAHHAMREEEQMALFRQHVRQLLERGYRIKIGSSSSIHHEPSPLEALTKNYSVQLFSSALIHGDLVLEIPALYTDAQITGLVAGESAIILRTTDWITGEEVLVKTMLMGSPEELVKEAFKKPLLAHIDKRYADGFAIQDILDASPTPPAPRQSPELIAVSEHTPTIPEAFADAEFAFQIVADTAWGRTEFEPGSGAAPLIFNRQTADLQKQPLRVTGRVEQLLITLPQRWATAPSDAKELGKGEVKGKEISVWEWTDPQGNRILYNDIESKLLVFPRFPKNGEPASHHLDLTPFGLGELVDVLDVHSTVPLGKIGSNEQYDLYAQRMGLGPAFENAVSSIERVEIDFGVSPGTFITGIRLVEDADSNATVDYGDRQIVEVYEGILTRGDDYSRVGYHEGLHVIDLQLGISTDPRFLAFWKETALQTPEFLLWISERNFLPDQTGGHAWDSPLELFASLGTSLHHPDLKTRLAQSAPHFVERYIACLELLHEILQSKVTEGKLSRDAPVFEKIKETLTVARYLEYEAPLELEFTTKHYVDGKLTAWEAYRPRTAPQLSAQLKGAQDLILVGGRIEIPLFASSFSEQLLGDLYGEINLGVDIPHADVTFFPEVGLSTRYHFIDAAVAIDVGGILAYSPLSADIAPGFTAGVSAEVALDEAAGPMKSLRLGTSVSLFPWDDRAIVSVGIGAGF